MDAPDSRIRITTQRQFLLEELAKTNSHPTACELYDKIRQRLPRIGLGTVYRNLEVLADSGLIRKIEGCGAQKRFDAVVKPHYHVRCSMCGRLEDIDLNSIKELIEAAAAKTAYNIIRHRIEFIGECPACQKKERKS